MDFTQLPTPEERLARALEVPAAQGLADVRMMLNAAGNWYVRIITSQAEGSWLARYAFFPKLPNGAEILMAGKAGVIFHPETASELFPEYAHLEYEAVATKDGINLKTK